MSMRLTAAAFVVLAFTGCGPGEQLPEVTTAAETHISGNVTSSNGQEAGVWVIAETDDFASRFARIVVTDEQGRYLRRTMVTMMNEELGIAPHVIEAVVNHVSGLAKAGVAGVCNRALYLDDRRRALNVWSQYLTKLPLP